jgi:hypothetical protein
MKPDINHVLTIYLGTDENGGYQPLYCDERMRQAFPDTHSQMMELIAPYLDEDQTPDWSNANLDLNQEANRFAASLRRKFPELDDVTINALSNRWHFGWSR